MTGPIYVTDVGKQVAISGLLPDTANDLLTYVVVHGDKLAELLQINQSHKQAYRNYFDFCLLFACLSSPEFAGKFRTRFLHFSLDVVTSIPVAEMTSHLLKEKPWQPYMASANAASLLLEWINGVPMRDLEKRFSALRAGKIQGMAKEAVWCLGGFSEILAAATKPDLAAAERPSVLKNVSSSTFASLRLLIPAIRLLVWRLNTGFPTEILWMSELKDDDGFLAINRREALALHKADLFAYDEIQKRNNMQSMIKALEDEKVPKAPEKASSIQDFAREWHTVLRKKTQEKLIRQIPDYADFMKNFFDSRETAFQRNFENLLKAAGIQFILYDDGTRPGAFDYLLQIEGRQKIIVECKTKQGNSLVSMTETRSVLGAARQFGFNDNFCVTLCNPGINPDVLDGFSDCQYLSIVEAHDMAVALTRLITKKMSPQGFHDWLTQPGLVKAENIYAYFQDIETPSLIEVSPLSEESKSLG